LPLPVLKTGKSNKAMKAYLERATAHDEFMLFQSHDFRIGKRHLANMMGEDPETFSQNDIDVSYTKSQFKIYFKCISKL
jgi:small subunit ribosomal protein S9